MRLNVCNSVIIEQYFFYDGFGRLINERNRNGLEQNYFYDEEGQLKSKNNFDNTSTVISYSNDRTVRTVTYSDGSQNRFIYDALGNITEAENIYGKTQYSYDQGARLIYQKDVTTGEEVYFTYDDSGNRIKLLSSNRETAYRYGKNNEVLEVSDNKQRINIKLQYDINGREVSRQFGNGTHEDTVYDKAGRVIVKMHKGLRGELLWGEGYVYGEDGKRTSTVDNTGRVTFYEYNKKGQIDTVFYPFTQEMVNKLKEEAEENGLSGSQDIGTTRFLTSAEKAKLSELLDSMQYGLSYSLPALHTFIKESYKYDGNGNRIEKQIPYGKIDYTYDKENCLLSSGSHGQTFVTYSYDKMGNLLTEESSSKTVKYTYNSQNRMIYCEVTDKSKKEYAQTTYAYDAFGRRIIVKDKGEAALRTLYDGLTFDVIKQSPTFENGLFTDTHATGIRWNRTGKPTCDRYRYISSEEADDGNRYFYLDENTYKTSNTRYRGERTELYINGTIAAQSTSDYGSEYFTTDLLGSVRTTTDFYGITKSTISYDACGSLVEGSLTGSTDFGYLGKQHDPTTKLYNYGYRDYRPQDARFTTVDPIRDGDNWFIYCNGDPLNFVDLFGLLTIDLDPIVIGNNIGESKVSYTTASEYSNGNTTVTIMTDGTVVVSSTEPTNIVKITYGSDTNDAKAYKGQMEIYTADPTSTYNTTVSGNPDVKVPVISGGHKGASHTQKGVYLDVQQSLSQSEILNDPDHNPIVYRLYSDVLIHQGNDTKDINTGKTESCTGVTGDENGTASQYYQEVIKNMEGNNVVIVR